MSEVSDPELLRQLNDPASAPGGGDPRIPVGGGMKLGDPYDAARGGMQGLLDPVEGLAQFAEWVAGRQLTPDSLRNWARDFRKQARSTYAGIGGEVAGNVAGMAIPGAILGKLGLLGQATSLGGRAAEAAAAGAASGVVQPVEGGGDYGRAKINQALLGGVAGPLGGAAVGQAAKALPYVLHPVGGVTHAIMQALGKSSNLPSSTIGNLAQQLKPRWYGTGAGMYEGANPPPAAAPAPARPAAEPPAAPPPPPAPRPPAAQATAGAQSFNRRFKGDDDGDSE